MGLPLCDCAPVVAKPANSARVLVAHGKKDSQARAKRSKPGVAIRRVRGGCEAENSNAGDGFRGIRNFCIGHNHFIEGGVRWRSWDGVAICDPIDPSRREGSFQAKVLYGARERGACLPLGCKPRFAGFAVCTWRWPIKRCGTPASHRPA